jgi:hypothetical protein
VPEQVPDKRTVITQEAGNTRCSSRGTPVATCSLPPAPTNQPTEARRDLSQPSSFLKSTPRSFQQSSEYMVALHEILLNGQHQMTLALLINNTKVRTRDGHAQYLPDSWQCYP